MTPEPPRPRIRGRPAVAWVLVLAVCTGAAAAILSRPIGASLLSINAPVFDEALLAEIILGIALGALVVYLVLVVRGWSHRVPVPGQVVVTFLVVVMLATVFLVLASFADPGLHLPGGARFHPPPSGTGGNSSANSTNRTAAPGGGLGSFPVTASLPYILAVAAALVLVVFVVPWLVDLVRSRALATRGADEPVDDREQVRTVVASAIHRLGATSAEDPRQVILALYAQLLEQASLRLGNLDPATPREIERAMITAFRLRPETARTLTTIFEEARYSSHPMYDSAVARARVSLAQALADLSAFPIPRP